MKKYDILLFAAGLGTRMQHLVRDKPKSLITVAGKPLLDHALEKTDLPAIGTRVVNLHYKADQIRNHLTDQNITFSDEKSQLLDTGGGLRHAIALLNSNPVMTTNTDAVWNGPNPMEQVISAWRDGMEALLLIVPKKQAFGHLGKGDFDIDSDHHLHRGSEYIYTGVQMIRTETVIGIKQDVFSMNVVWNQINSRKKLFGVIYSGQWCDVGQPSSIPLAEEMLKNNA